ncbi:MAG: ATP-binding protein [Candidatus Gracilibacteria bacterium]|nr:ATP-binding protein [Candidatus Gracilibacteria bacterium]MDQ7022588.1 ATP-binding protein [Candidatus Gracilibacteria bacterium]
MKKINISNLLTEEERQHIIRSNFDKKGLDIGIEYPAIFASSKVLRDFIIDIANFFHFKGTWKSRLTLIADELNNNGIEYGSVETDINKMYIKVFIINDEIELTLEVEDSGNGKETKTAKEMILKRNTKKLKGFNKNNGIRGRGLFMIIEKLVDELYFKDSEKGGLIVGIRKKIEIEV